MSTFLLYYFSTFPSILQALYAKDEKIWQDQHQMSERFATSKPNISMYIANILKESGLYKDSVVKEFLTTAADGKNYNLVFLLA